MPLLLAQFSPIDYATVVLYFCLMLWLGFHFTRRQKDTEEYFVASRGIPWWAAGLSIFATVTSTLSYLFIPGEMIKHGVGFLAHLLGVPLVFLAVGYIVIPFFMRRRGTSAYEYLEERFGLPTRLLAASVFLFIRVTWMGMIVFASSVAMTTVVGLDPESTWVIALALGIVAILYTTMGGLRAVIWTDVVQFIILFGGALFTVCYVALETSSGPITWWQDAAAAAGQRVAQPLWSWDPFTRVSLGGMVINFFFFWACTANSDQVVVQRYFSMSSAAAARRSFALTMTANVVMVSVLSACGLALFSYYKAGLPARPDDVFPHFIGHQLPVGLAGLVVAALFSAAMSSLDSGMNSIATIIITDYYRRLYRRRPGAQAELTLARVITALVGMLAVVICLMLNWVPEDRRGNLLDMANQVCTFAVGGLGGLFFIAMLQRRCTASAAMVSLGLGMVVGFVLALGHWIVDLGQDELGNPLVFSWMWIVPCSAVVTFLSAAMITRVRDWLWPSKPGVS